MHLRCLLSALALAASVSVHAQTPSAPTLPKPAEFYFDADAMTTREVVAVRGTGDGVTERLLRAIARNPHAKAEHAQLAHLAMAGGRPDLGRELYARALTRVYPADALWRPVLWNYGWDLYRTGDAAAALEQWSTLVASRSSSAAWVPPTLALVLWKLDRRAEALDWYAAAVRTEPQQWNTATRFVELLPQWRDEERATLAEVQAAWAAAPPAGA